MKIKMNLIEDTLYISLNRDNIKKEFLMCGYKYHDNLININYFKKNSYMFGITNNSYDFFEKKWSNNSLSLKICKT